MSVNGIHGAGGCSSCGMEEQAATPAAASQADAGQFANTLSGGDNTNVAQSGANGMQEMLAQLIPMLTQLIQSMSGGEQSSANGSDSSGGGAATDQANNKYGNTSTSPVSGKDATDMM